MQQYAGGRSSRGDIWSPDDIDSLHFVSDQHREISGLFYQAEGKALWKNMAKSFEKDLEIPSDLHWPISLETRVTSVKRVFEELTENHPEEILVMAREGAATAADTYKRITSHYSSLGAQALSASKPFKTIDISEEIMNNIRFRALCYKGVYSEVESALQAVNPIIEGDEDVIRILLQIKEYGLGRGANYNHEILGRMMGKWRKYVNEMVKGIFEL